MNYAEILEKLIKLKLNPNKMGKFAETGKCIISGWDGSEYDVIGLLETHFGNVEIINKSPFHEDYECWCVFYFKDFDIYLKYNGFLSYSDPEWKNPIEVRPYEKTIIEYK